MAKKSKMIPFNLLPASWGLKGKTRQIAEAEYYYEGDELEYKLLEINSTDENDLKLKKLELDLKKEKITQAQHDKEFASINNEPWVEVKRMEVDLNNPKAGYMELDWNDNFVKMLMEKGYSGESDESVVNKWFNDICRTVLLQEANDMDFGLEEYPSADVIKINEHDKTKRS